MPKRMVDGDRIWTSDKLRSVEPEERRFDYANLLPLALANGSFECSPGRVLRDVYFYLRPSFSLEDVEEVLNEYERARLLFRWRDEHGKVWGFWVGITSEGLLPAKAHVDRGDYKKGKEPPADLLQKFIDGEIESGLLPASTPGGAPGENKGSPDLPPAGVGKDRVGKDRVGEGNQFPFSEKEDNGQESDMSTRLKKEIQAVCAGYGVRPGVFKNTWSDLDDLSKGNSVGAVVRDFTGYMEEYKGDDFPNGAVPAYLKVAHFRLSSDAPSILAAKDPEIVSLTRELSYMSSGCVAFGDKQRIRLSEVLREFSKDEITSVFRVWFDSQDTSDLKTQKWGANEFVQKADQLCYAARKQRQEAEEAKTQRDAAVVKMQEQAELERKQAEEKKVKEAEVFDPLEDLLSETDQTVV